MTRNAETWEVYPRLFIGRVPEPGETFVHDALVCCEPYLPAGVTCRGVVIHRPFIDSEEPCHQVEAERLAVELSREVAARWRAGQSIRVSCMAGLNRSGLVVAATLVRLGLSPREAIERLRWKRGSMALCNRTFVLWLSTKFEAVVAGELDEAKGHQR